MYAHVKYSKDLIFKLGIENEMKNIVKKTFYKFFKTKRFFLAYFKFNRAT